MGSWNQTCGLSQLPIEYGDDVRLIVLRENPYLTDYAHPDGHCYSFHLWQPVCLPLKGVYDDYGGVERIEADDAANILRCYLSVENGLNEYDLELLTHDVRERVFTYKRTSSLSPNKEQELSYAYMLVLEDVFQTAVGIARNSQAYYSSQSFGEHFFSLVREYNEKAASMQRKVGALNSSGLEELPDDLKEIFLSSCDLVVSLRDYMAGYKVVLQGLEHGLPADKLVDALLFNTSVMRLRKTYMPQAGQGSQSVDFDWHATFLEGVLEIATKRRVAEERLLSEFEDE